MIEKKRALITLASKLSDIPREWLRHIEPKIERRGTCWFWEGACDLDGEPVISFRNMETGKRNTRRVKLVIADMFWAMKKFYQVIHHCGNLNCLNPWHFYISRLHHSQEDRDELVAAKRKNLQTYLDREKAEG